MTTNRYLYGGIAIIVLLFSLFLGLKIDFLDNSTTTTSAYSTTNYDYEQDNVLYTFGTDNTATVVGYSGAPTSVSFPETVSGYTVTTIGDGAFIDCSSLISVTIPSTITTIGFAAFTNCVFLESVDTDDATSLQFIGAYAFAYCLLLDWIYLPASLTSLGALIPGGSPVASPFVCCPNLMYELDPNNTSFYEFNGVIYTSDLTTIICTDNANLCLDYDDCGGFPILTTAQTVLTGAFNLTGGFETIEKFVFWDLDAAEVVDASDYLSIVDGGLLCNKDETILYTIAPFFDTIDSTYALPSTITDIDSMMLWLENLASITIPAATVTIPSVITGWNLTEIIVDSANSAFCSVDGVLYSKDMTTLQAYPMCKAAVEEFVIPSTVDSIFILAFMSAEINSITIPESVTNIYCGAFNGATTSSFYFNNDISTCEIHSGAFTSHSSTTTYYFKDQASLDYAANNYSDRFSNTNFEIMENNGFEVVCSTTDYMTIQSSSRESIDSTTASVVVSINPADEYTPQFRINNNEDIVVLREYESDTPATGTTGGIDYEYIYMSGVFILTLSNLTPGESYTVYLDAIAHIEVETGAHITYDDSATSRDSKLATTAFVGSVLPNSGYGIRMSLPTISADITVNLTGASGEGEIGGVQYSYVFKNVTVPGIEFSNIPEGRFRVVLEAYSLYNVINNSDHISGVQSSYNNSNFLISANYQDGYYPRVQINDSGYLTILDVLGSGQLSGATFQYTITNGSLSLVLSNLVEYTQYTVYLDAYSTNPSTANINLNVTGSTSYTYKVEEDSLTNSKTLVFYPTSSMYVTHITVDNGTAVEVNRYVGQIIQQCNAHSLNYTANNTTTDNMFTLTANRMSGDISITLTLSTTPPVLTADEPIELDTIAVQATTGGEARVVGASIDDIEYTLIALAYGGYEFVGWSIDGGISYLVDPNAEEEGTLYGASATISASQIKGKVVCAYFKLKEDSEYIEDQTDNTNGTSDIL